MSALDKAKNKAEELGGRAKEAAGDLTGDKDLQAEGQQDQTSGQAKNVGENLKDAAGNVKKAFGK